MSREYPLIESIDCLADLLEPDAIVYYDFDQVAYQAAASCEKRTIEVTHKASGRKKVFKTRTEFWGRQKNAVGGWLKAENTNREAACKKLVRSLFRGHEKISMSWISKPLIL